MQPALSTARSAPKPDRKEEEIDVTTKTTTNGRPAAVETKLAHGSLATGSIVFMVLAFVTPIGAVGDADRGRRRRDGAWSAARERVRAPRRLPGRRDHPAVLRGGICGNVRARHERGGVLRLHHKGPRAPRWSDRGVRCAGGIQRDLLRGARRGRR